MSPLPLLVLLLTLAPAGPLETCRFAGQPGFRCPRQGDCLPLEWVCDGEVQCQHPDDADEEEGCNMYPETGEAVTNQGFDEVYL